MTDKISTEELPGRRHEWKRTDSGTIDAYAFDGDTHAGPRCTVCHDAFCLDCEPQRWREVLTESDPADCDGPYVRKWSLPAEPGPEVTAVRDCDDDVWERDSVEGWSLNDGASSAWIDVLRFGPLTDATPTTEEPQQ